MRYSDVTACEIFIFVRRPYSLSFRNIYSIFFRLFFQLKRKSASYRVPADQSPDSSPITVTKNTSSRNVMVALKSISEVDSKLEKDGSKTNSVNESLKDDCLIKVLSMHTLIDLPAIDLKK